jgi:general secretion pathway protein C
LALLLGALLTFDLIRIAALLLGHARSLTADPASGLPPRVIAMPSFDVRGLIDAHLFGIAGADSSGDLDPERVPRSTSTLILAGTIASEDPRRGIAIIAENGVARVYAAGEQVAGATVHSVFLDRVLLDRGGQLEALLLPRAADHLALTRATAQPSGQIGPADDHPLPEAAAEDARRRLGQYPALLGEIVRAVPAPDVDADGRLFGYRAFPGANVAAFSKTGLRTGDLLVAVNGVALDDLRRSQDLLNTRSATGNVTLSVDRAGRRMNLSVSLADLAAGTPGGP